MAELRCDCGEVFTGDEDELVAASKAHFDVAHPQFGVTETMARNYVAASLRETGPTERLDAIGTVEVERVEGGRIGDVLRFFDTDAFADNPGWAACYCMFHHVMHEGQEAWSRRPWQDNRSGLEERLGTGTTTAYVATVDGRVAGWVNASPRPAYPEHDEDGDATVGAVVCFVVAPPYRGHGVARRLLDAAVAGFRASGTTVIEAYPPAQPRDAAQAYRGTVALFEEAGFEPVRHEEDGTVVVRKRLV